MELILSGTPSITSLVRACAASGIAAFERVPASKVVTREWSRDSGAEWLLRAPVEPTDMASAPALARTVVSDLVSTLAGHSAAAKLFNEGLKLSFDSHAEISVPTLEGDSSYASFVAERAPIPVMQGQTAPLVTLTPHKLAAIVVFTHKMVHSSNIEALMLDALKRSIGLALDKVLLDDQPADDARPAGLRHGIAPLTASTAPESGAALMQDIEMCRRAVADVTPTHPIYVMSATRALMAQLRSQHGLQPLTVLGSLALKGTMIMLAITPENIASVLDGAPEISATRDAALQMDTMPSDISALRSMFQTDCVAILIKLPVTWAVRSPKGVAWVVTTNW